MKIRIISFLLILLLLPTMVVPAAASESNNHFLQVLDYPNPTGATINSSNSTVSFNLPGWNTLYYIDVLLIMAGESPTYVTCSFSGHSFALNILPVDPAHGLYRLYGSLPGYSANSFDLSFSTSGTTWLTFKSVEVSTISIDSFFTSAHMSGDLDSGSFSVDYTPGGSLASYLTSYDNTSIDTDDFSAFIYVPEWRKFDYIDLILSFTVGEIASVDVGLSDMSVNMPFTVNYLFDTTSLPTTQMVTVRIDLSGINRTTSADLEVFISGALGYGVNVFSIFGCVGHVSFENDPYIYYFQNLVNFFRDLTGKINILSSNLSQWISGQTADLKSHFNDWFGNLSIWISNQTTAIKTHLNDWFGNLSIWISTWGQNIVNSINPDPNAGQDVKEEGAEKGEVIGGLNDQMNALNKPDLSGSGDISSIISPGDLSNYTTFLTTVVNAPYISQVVMLSFILSLAAYVLFGKR